MKNRIALVAPLLLAACASFPATQTPPRAVSEVSRLAPDMAINRIALGSCNRQDQAQDVWNVIAAGDPQAFLAMGDNVYGDIGYDGSSGMETFVSAYAAQAASAPFAALRGNVPIIATWDDHDYGPNDSGGSFPHRATSEAIFEAFWNTPAEARARPGVYHSITTGPAGQRVQIIVLDTRFFRSDMVALPADDPRGRYTANTAPDATVLGAAQWQWLEQELAEPADLRVLVSSIQVISQAHGWEAWARFPHERQRLLDMLAARAGGGLVVVSGDRHAAAFYETEAGGEPIIEFTSSSLNRPMTGGTEAATAREPDPQRLGRMIADANFGTLDIDWARRAVTMAIRNDSGEVVDQLVREF